ncbi:MAG: hypothetical protein QW051_03690 [Candidatus Aenigmatarchaeota archaeon]
MKNKIQFNRTPDFFTEYKGTEIKVVTKFFEDDGYYVYKGTLCSKSSDFIYLKDCEVVKIKFGQEIERKTMNRVALNKAIVSVVDFS